MVVDDDDILQFTTKMMLKMIIPEENYSGYLNPALALAYLQTNQAKREAMPDLLLLDINMPIMDGFEFLDMMTKTVTQNVPLIFMVSSSISPDDIKLANSYKHVKEYLSKPVLTDRLRESIERHLG